MMSRHLFVALFVASGAVGCGQVWGPYTVPDPENCVRDPNVCKGGEHCNMETQACEPTDFTPVDPFPPPTAPTTFISPGGLVSTLTYPRDVKYTLAAPKPAMIYYTLDGSTPVAGTSYTFAAQNKLLIGALPTATRLTWFADYGPSFDPEMPRSFTAVTDPAVPVSAGSISEEVQFGLESNKTVLYNLGPVVTVSRLSRVAVRINLQVWTATGGNGRLQYVVSGQGLGIVGCLDNIQEYGPFPGRHLTLFVTFNAPFLPGRYPLQAGVVERPTCDRTPAPALGAEIGQILVQ
jgi:hypothetical protein